MLSLAQGNERQVVEKRELEERGEEMKTHNKWKEEKKEGNGASLWHVSYDWMTPCTERDLRNATWK